MVVPPKTIEWSHLGWTCRITSLKVMPQMRPMQSARVNLLSSVDFFEVSGVFIGVSVLIA